MSRDFKQEYEQHMNGQTPDLWARIEANLPVKEASMVMEMKESLSDATGVAAETTATPKVVQMKQRKAISRRWMTYGMTAAAALLICLLAVPVLRSSQGGRAESANFMAKDAALEMCVEGAADAGESENGNARYNADCAVPEAAIEAVEVEEECAVEQEADKEYAVADGASGSTSVETTGNSDAMKDTVNTAVGETKSETSEMKQRTFFVEVTIWEVYEQDGKVLYRGDITGQEAILIFGKNFSEDASLEIGEMYEMTLEEAEEDAIWDYVIIGM